MTNTATAVPVDDVGDDLQGERDALLQALAGLAEERYRQRGLEDARERARRKRWVAESAASQARVALQQALRDEPSRVAYEFANNDTVSSPTDNAQTAVEAATAELGMVSKIEASLDSELEQLSRRVQRRQADVNEALANVIVNSDAFHHLLNELDAAWGRVRGLRKACLAIDVALHGHLPSAYQSKWQQVPSLDPLAMREVTDEKPATLWQQAIEDLLSDPDTSLPVNI